MLNFLSNPEAELVGSNLDGIDPLGSMGELEDRPRFLAGSRGGA